MVSDPLVLFRRIPWRLLVAGFGGGLVARGVSLLLATDGAVSAESLISIFESGIRMVILGGVVLIGVIVSR